MPKINHEEYKMLKGLDKEWKWIARDSCGSHGGNLFAYSEKPYKKRDTGDWVCDGRWYDSIDDDLFQSIQWEDREPCSIAELIEEYEGSPIKSTPWTPNSLDFGNEETEVKKDNEWLKEEVTEILLTSKKDGTNYFYYRDLKEKIYNAIDQFDKPEVLSQEDNINIVLDDLKEHIKEQQSLSQNVGMAHTSAGNDTHYRQYDYVLECINEYEPSDDLQNLLVPKQEEVDRAYKDGYEKGKEHATRDDEPETVASVMADYFGAAARLIEVLAMEVEELED